VPDLTLTPNDLLYQRMPVKGARLYVDDKLRGDYYGEPAPPAGSPAGSSAFPPVAPMIRAMMPLLVR
jgi:hypothetical protein